MKFIFYIVNDQSTLIDCGCETTLDTRIFSLLSVSLLMSQLQYKLR